MFWPGRWYLFSSLAALLDLFRRVEGRQEIVFTSRAPREVSG
jgi:hypothetical protein